MTKFEREFHEKIMPHKDNLDLMKVRKHFKDWHSDEEYQALKEDYNGQADSILLMLEEIGSLKSQIQQQALPVVPECVGVAIGSLPDHCSAFEAISLIEQKVETLPVENEDWLPVYNWLCEGVENQDIFALAFITGKYQVEKPQLFYLKATDSRGHEYLNLDTSEKSIFLSGKKQYDGFQTKFTLEEIKGNSLLKPFIDKIVPVEDGE